MKLTTNTIDLRKKEQYIRELEEYKQKYIDKKSELQWADNEYEESFIQSEINSYARKIRRLKTILEQIKDEQSVA